MRVREFNRELWLPFPPTELFRFFGDAANLEAMGPPWLNFQMVTPSPIELKEGALIDYRLRVHGLPFNWGRSTHSCISCTCQEFGYLTPQLRLNQT